MSSAVEIGTASDLLTAALAYLDRGWSIVPLIGKRPPKGFAWARFQSERPRPAEVREWFSRHRGLTGIGVVLGRISGGLVVRDFDEESSYWEWAKAHPDYAKSLPTVQTARGKHVYFRTGVGIKSQKFCDGELRAEGQYVVLPPSQHPCGDCYRWELLPNGPIPATDAHLVGLCQAWIKLETSQKTKTDQTPKTTQSIKSSNPSNPSIPLFLYSSINSSGPSGPLLLHSSISNLVEFFPKKVHDSHWRLFRLARALRGIAQERGQPLSKEELRAVFEAWYSRSKKFLRPELVREDYWLEFRSAVDSARVPLGQEVLSSAWAIAKDAVPDETGLRYESRAMQQLVRLCAELQRQIGDKPFYLSSYTVARLFRVSNVTAWHRLRGLVRDGVLELVERGNREKANRYRYLPALPPVTSVEQGEERRLMSEANSEEADLL